MSDFDKNHKSFGTLLRFLSASYNNNKRDQIKRKTIFDDFKCKREREKEEINEQKTCVVFSCQQINAFAMPY